MNQENKIRVFTKKFESLKDVLSDEVCTNHIKSKLDGLNIQRLAGPPPGMKFKRTGYDSLKERGQLNVRFFTQVYPLIEEKKSTLPSSQRDLIESVVISAIRATIEAHSVIIEAGLNFGSIFMNRTEVSPEFDRGTIQEFDTKENTIKIRQRIGKTFNEVVWKFDETMERFEKGELVKL